VPDVSPLTLPPPYPRPARKPTAGVARTLVVTVTADSADDLDLVASGLADFLRLMPHQGNTPDRVAITVRSLTDHERTADQLAAQLDQATEQADTYAERYADAIDQADQLAAELERARAHLAGVEAAAIGLGLAPELAALLVGLDPDRLAMLADLGDAAQAAAVLADAC
jgi:hypothetical protein